MIKWSSWSKAKIILRLVMGEMLPRYFSEMSLLYWSFLSKLMVCEKKTES